MSSATDEERNVSGRTRGNKSDAWQQEKEVDQALAETGVLDAEKDVEVSKAVGY